MPGFSKNKFENKKVTRKFLFLLSFALFLSPIVSLADEFGNTEDTQGPKPTAAAEVQANTTGNIDKTRNGVNLGSLDVCSTGVFSNASAVSLFTTCPSYAFAKIGIFALNTSSDFLDFILPIALNVEYLRPEANGEPSPLERIWSNIRDVTNALFIIAIVWIAGLMVKGSSNYRRPLINLIIIAFVINFSLLITRSIVDMGNFTALLLYNSIEVKNAATKQLPLNLSSTNKGDTSLTRGETEKPKEVKSITGAFLAVLNPAVFFGKRTLTAVVENENDTGTEKYYRMMILLLTLGAVSGFVAWNFFKVGLVFLSRAVLLILYAVISPLAFASYFIPGKDSYLSKWFSNVVQVSFCVTVYMFFVYLIFSLIVGDDALFQIDTQKSLNNLETGGNTKIEFTDVMITIVIQYTIVILLLSMGLKYAKQFCDKVDVGDMALSGAKKVGGLGLGVATVGAGVIARNSLGRFGRRMALNEGLNNWEAKGGARAAVAKPLLYSFEKLENAKFGTKEGVREVIDRRSKEQDQQRKRNQNARASKMAIRENITEKEALKKVKKEDYETLSNKKTTLIGSAVNFALPGVAEEEKTYLKREDLDKVDLMNKNQRKAIEEKARENRDEDDAKVKTETSKIVDGVSTAVAKEGINKDSTLESMIGSEQLTVLKDSYGEKGKKIFENTVKEVDSFLESRYDSIEDLGKIVEDKEIEIDEHKSIADKISEPGYSKKSLSQSDVEMLSDKEKERLGIEFDDQGRVSGDYDIEDLKNSMKRAIKKEEDELEAQKKEYNRLKSSISKEVQDRLRDGAKNNRTMRNEEIKTMSSNLQTSADNATEEIQKAQEFVGDSLDLEVTLDGAMIMPDNAKAVWEQFDDTQKKAILEGKNK